jgi:cytidylate kinase
MSIITISRGTFSGGKAVAMCLADKLGYPCISREVILDAAAEHGISIDKLTEAMERPPSFWQQVSGDRDIYLNYIREALCERAKEGNLIYHGHAGHLLLAGVSHMIRVRVVADMNARIETAMQRMNISRKEAVARIKEADLMRMKWTKFLYGVEWRDAYLYDVILNIERMGLEGACTIVAEMTKMPCYQPTAESRKALADCALASRVWAVLAKDPRTKAIEVKVVADDGIVTVSGSTRSWDAIAAVPVVAGEVEGVREVHNQVGFGSVLVA